MSRTNDPYIESLKSEIAALEAESKDLHVMFDKEHDLNIQQKKQIAALKAEIENTRVSALKEAAVLCEKTRCREWSPYECGYQIRIQLIAEQGEKQAHWTKTPPTEPGWYQARENKGEPEFLRVHEDAEDGALYILRGCDRYALTYRENWWSEKETFPPLPEGDPQ